MSHILSEIEPKVIWDHFQKLSQIPRPSKEEKQVCEFIYNMAKELALDVKMDNAGGDGFGNIVVKVDATPGYEHAPTVVFQSHVDMVALPVERKYDPLQLVLDNTMLRADGTTLGVDNGIAVAMAMALMTEKDIEHGPLELLFTTDEETGMVGARSLSEDFLQGRYLINVDSEEEGTLTVGCAGGNRTQFHLPLVKESLPEGVVPIKLRATGCKGGHSGVEIHTGRANAGQLLMRMLYEESKTIKMRLVSVDWGSVDNAIPSEAEVVIVVNMEQLSDLKGAVTTWEDGFKQEFGRVEPGLQILWEEGLEMPEQMMSPMTTNKVISFLLALPHGVERMSADIPDLVETSSNVAIVKTLENELNVSMSQRSSVLDALNGIISKCEAIATLAGATFTQGSRYGGWKPNMDSKLLKNCSEVYTDMFGAQPKVAALHAGLECGLIGDRYPGMDMISIGPTIIDAHAPTKSGFQPGVDSDTKGERIDTARMPEFWRFVRAILKRLAEM